ncbi:MAG: thioredoxin domain-containing protein [Dermatophilaceae bacterium]|jgi:protein-disulfide isomerase|nr:thioredoxin domain-containing protein [Dermatophilaceae bacterium]
MPRPDATDKLAATAPSSTNRILIGGLIALVSVAVVVALLFIGIGKSNPGSSGTPAITAGSGASAGTGGAAATGGTAPTGATSAPGTANPASNGAVPKGALGFGQAMVVNPHAQGVPTLDVYEDPQCPACALFEGRYGPTVAQLVQNNQVKLVVHTMTFLDMMLRNDSSVRAANGAFCAADQGKFYPYMGAVYAAQPAKEGTGYTDDQLKQFAVSVGVADLATWQTCQQSLTYQAHIAALEDTSEKSGVTGTPTIKINGTVLKLTGNPAELTAAVQAAKG